MLMALCSLVWLSSLIGSFPLSAAILRGAFALVAWAIYRFSIREELRALQARIETIYEVAHAAPQRLRSGLLRRLSGCFVPGWGAAIRCGPRVALFGVGRPESCRCGSAVANTPCR